MGFVQSTRRASSAPFHRFLSTIETAAWVVALGCLLYVGARYIDGTLGSRGALQRFEELQATQDRTVAPDMTLWSPQRIAAWQKTLAMTHQAPLAVLRIPRIHLEVAVLDGTSEVTLNRAVGHIEETAMPGMSGNSGIAGHRDGFFRGLKDVSVGDAMELDTLQGIQIYRIERTWIVNPDDVSVLDPTNAQSITLVTCYPFYFVGSAPQRYIVRAVRVEPRLDASLESATSDLLR